MKSEKRLEDWDLGAGDGAGHTTEVAGRAFLPDPQPQGGSLCNAGQNKGKWRGKEIDRFG